MNQSIKWMPEINPAQRGEIAHAIRDFHRELGDFPDRLPLDSDAILKPFHYMTPLIAPLGALGVVTTWLGLAHDHGFRGAVACDGMVYRLSDEDRMLDKYLILADAVDVEGLIDVVDVSDVPLRIHSLSIVDDADFFRPTESTPCMVDLSLDTDLYAVEYPTAAGRIATAEGTRDEVAATLRAAGFLVRTRERTGNTRQN